MNSNKQETPTGISRFATLTYGLLYPAFIGNMIYDALLLKFNPSSAPQRWENTEFCLCVFIMYIVFYMLDYVHLEEDLNFLIPIKAKGWVYTIGDIMVSVSVFVSFVAAKYIHIGLAIFCLVFISLCFAAYNYVLKKDVDSFQWFHVYANGLYFILSFIGAIVYLFYINDTHLQKEAFLLYYLGAYMVYYLVYLIIGFWWPRFQRK